MRYIHYLAAAVLAVGVVHCTAATDNNYGGLASKSNSSSSGSASSSSGSSGSSGTTTADAGTGPIVRPDPVLAFSFNADSGVLSAKIMANVATGASLKVNIFAIDNGAPTAIDCDNATAVDLTTTTTDGKYVVAPVPVDDQFLSGRLDGTTRTAIQGCLSDSTGKSIVQLQTSILNAWDLDGSQEAALPRVYHGIQAYAEGCEDAVGEIPMFANGTFACDAPGMVVLPITATASNGTVTRLDETTTNWPLTSAQLAATQHCDTPAWLGYEGDVNNSTQCAPFTRIGQFQNSQGTRFIAVCRREAVRPLSDTTYENINFVVHSPTTGKTCWFNNHLDGTSTDGSSIPTPDATDADKFWMDMGSIQGQRCPSCHDSDPWIHSPWVDQALDKTTGHTVVPRIQQDPAYTIDVKYSIFGRESFLGTQQANIDWQQPQFVQNVGSCGSCHRIGTGQTLQIWADRTVELVRNDDVQDYMTSTGETNAVKYMPADQSSMSIIDGCGQNPSGCTFADEPH